MRNAILRLVPDEWKLGLREGMGSALTVRLASVPRAKGPEFLFPSHLSPELPAQSWLLGVPWPWCPGVIVPKLYFPVPSPQKLVGVRRGIEKDESLGAYGASCLCSYASN